MLEFVATCDLKHIQQRHSRVHQAQPQNQVEVVDAIAKVEGGVLHAIQCTVSSAHDIVPDKVPQGKLHATVVV